MDPSRLLFTEVIHMKRSILMVSVVAAMLLMASSVFAAGLNLRWTNCLGDAGTSNKTSACTSNLGTNAVVGSFVVANDIVGATGIEPIVDVVVNDTAPPAWWSATCRAGFMNANPTISPAAANCFEWASGVAGGLGKFWETTPTGGNNYGPNTGRAVMAFATATPTPVAAGPGNEYFAFNLTISNTKSTGTGSCAGCTTAACLVFNSVKIVAGTSTAAFIEGGNAAGTNIATWQGTAANCAAVPTRNTSWGAVKSLYR